jgi:hypothetical protein
LPFRPANVSIGPLSLLAPASAHHAGFNLCAKIILCLSYHSNHPNNIRVLFYRLSRLCRDRALLHHGSSLGSTGSLGTTVWARTTRKLEDLSSQKMDIWYFLYPSGSCSLGTTVWVRTRFTWTSNKPFFVESMWTWWRCTLYKASPVIHFYGSSSTRYFQRSFYEIYSIAPSSSFHDTWISLRRYHLPLAYQWNFFHY